MTRVSREVIMKKSRFIVFCTIFAFVFCLTSPAYSASKKKKAQKETDTEAVEAKTEDTAEVKAEDKNESEVVEKVEPEAEDKTITETENKVESKTEDKAETEKKKAKKKSAKQIQREKNNFSGWVEPRGRSIEEVYGSIKLRIRNRIGSFNVSMFDEESKKTVSALSTSDEYTTSGFYLKVGKKIVELNSDSGVRKSAWKTDTGAAIGYRIENLADVIVYFDVFASSEDYDMDSLKVTVKVTNMSKKKEYYAVKLLLDTILGETDRHHFYDSNNNPVKNEVAFREFDENKWFVSKNSSGSLQVIFDGGECTKPELVALANYSTLDTRNWEPDLLTYRAFDTVLSYNNSAIGITWPRHRLGADEQFTEVFYLSTAFGERKPSGAAYVLGIEPEQTAQPVEVVQAEPNPQKEEKVEQEKEKTPVNVEEKKEEPVSTLPPYVPFDVKTLTRQQLSPEYIQALLERIEALEESDESIDKEELVLLNAELDTILEALRL